MLPSLSRSGFLCLRASSSRVTLGSALSPRLLRPQARPHQLRFPLRTSSTSTKPDIALNDTPVTSAIAHELADPKRPAAPETLFDRVLPKWAMGAKPYLLLTRIDKPNGAILLFWPGAWAITMAASVNHLPPTVPAFYLGLFAVGALVMRGAGCTVNDMWDAKFDRQVERTKWRPIAAGDVSQLGALTFLGAQLSVGLAILTQLNWYSIVLGASSVGFVIMYPFMKRITYYPQIFFALTFHWGCMLGWSAVTGSVNWPVVLPMYIGSIAWGVMYDCIYAHQDKLDDIKAGVKSIALRFPDSRPLISGLSAFFVSGLTLTGHLAGLGPLYYVISCLGSALHLGWQCKTVDFDNRQDCWRKFCSNGLLGGLIWLGIAADYIYEVVIPGDYE